MVMKKKKIWRTLENPPWNYKGEMGILLHEDSFYIGNEKHTT